MTRRLPALCAAAAALAASSFAPNARADWPTYHRNGARTGAVEDGPRPEKAHRIWSRAVDGAVYAEPLVVGNRAVVATQNDSLYAFGAAHGKRRWRRHLGEPVPRADTEAAVAPGCSTIALTGITGTPVIDRRAGVVYAVAFLRRPTLRHVLFAVSLKTGRVRWRRRVDPPGVDPRIHQQRSALALSKGRVYVTYGGLAGDCGDYHGWVVGARTTGKGPLVTWRAPARRQAGIWAPSGPAVARDGSLYVATGDGDSPSFDYGSSVIHLGARLKLLDFFSPADNGQLNVFDEDLGSVGPLLLPHGRVFATGKSGVAYVLDARHLGGIGHPLTEYARLRGNDSYGGLAFAHGTVFVPARNAGVVALRLQGKRLSLSWATRSFRAGPPIVAGPAVWALDLAEGTLYALGRVSGRVRFRASIPQPAQFSTPAAAGGRIYVAGGRRLIAFGD